MQLRPWELGLGDGAWDTIPQVMAPYAKRRALTGTEVLYNALLPHAL